MARAPGSTAAQLVHQDAALRITVLKNLQVNAWLDAPSLTQMRLHAAQAEALHRAYPAGTGLVNLMLGGTPKFSDGVRDAAVRMVKNPAFYSLGSVHVVLMTGLAGAAVRGFMGTVLLLARSPTPSKVLGDIDSAALWLAPLLARGPVAWTAAELTDLLKATAATAAAAAGR